MRRDTKLNIYATVSSIIPWLVFIALIKWTPDSFLPALGISFLIPLFGAVALLLSVISLVVKRTVWGFVLLLLSLLPIIFAIL
jgi:hypothetical protein